MPPVGLSYPSKFPPGLFISHSDVQAFVLPDTTSDLIVVLAPLSDSSDLLEVKALSDFSNILLVQALSDSNDLLLVAILSGHFSDIHTVQCLPGA